MFPNRTNPSAASSRALALCALGLILLLAPALARATDFQWHGTLDLVAAERTHGFQLNTLTRGDNPFDPYRLRLVAESHPNDRLQVLGQFLFDDASGLYVDGAYAIFTPWHERDLHLMMGKLPWAIGTWAPRTYSNRNPLIGAPLMYQNHTTLLWYDIPPTADALLATAGRGAYGVNYFGYPEGTGMPIIDDSYWDVGVTVTGSARPLEYALGAVAGTPSWGSTKFDDNSGKSVLGRLGFSPIPDLRIGVSGSYGPYLVEKLNPRLPVGKSVNDYNQKLLMADLEVMVGHVELRAEGARNFWETPTVGELSVNTGYAELKYLFDNGTFLAGRYDLQDFGDIQNSAGQSLPWDWNVVRGEGGLGYRISRDAVAKLAYQHSQFDSGVAGSPKLNRSIFAAQLSIGF
jgi:hypothetical protein